MYFSIYLNIHFRKKMKETNIKKYFFPFCVTLNIIILIFSNYYKLIGKDIYGTCSVFFNLKKVIGGDLIYDATFLFFILYGIIVFFAIR